MTRSATFRAETLVGATLAILFSINTVFIIIFSTAGVAGNPTFSGSLLIACEATILILSMRHIKLGYLDYLFGGFVLAAAISYAMNGLTAGFKETAIFVVSVACCPVCRFVCITDRVKTAFGATSLYIAIIGACATAYAIFEQWPVYEGKPIVFGNDAAGTHFLMALGFFVIAVTTQKRTPKQATLILVLVLVTSAIFAAALVRFTFAAMLATLGLSWLLNIGKQRAFTSMIAASIVLGAGCGILIRFDKIPVLIGFMTERTAHRSEPMPPPPTSEKLVSPAKTAPSCAMEVNMRNSFAERKALWQDSLYLIPRAGLFGLGLDGFMKDSCMKGFPPHNSVFQAFIEFGWMGGIALSAMIAIAFFRLIPTARFDETERFIICMLTFAVLISLAHGRLSRDFVLFSMLGIAITYIDHVTAAVRSSGPKDFQ